MSGIASIEPFTTGALLDIIQVHKYERRLQKSELNGNNFPKAWALYLKKNNIKIKSVRVDNRRQWKFEGDIPHFNVGNEAPQHKTPEEIEAWNRKYKSGYKYWAN